MTPDAEFCSAIYDCPYDDADLMAFEREQGMKPRLRFSLWRNTAPATVVDPTVCLHCDDAKGCPHNNPECGEHHCAECGVGELRTDYCAPVKEQAG